MAMTLDRVVPFGRTMAEYVAMFNLTEADRAGRLLGAGDGPASFNAQATTAGGRVVSFDPVYAFTGAEIRGRFDAVVDNIIAQVKATPEDWVWRNHAGPDALRARRVEALELFLADYDAGLAAGRYLNAELPTLPFADQSFALALCSHFLFLYSLHFDAEFHVRAIAELLRVAREVRVFPLLTLAREPSPHLDAVLAWCASRGFVARVEKTGYELQKGGNEMLRICRQA